MACAYVRPTGIHGLTPKSVKKKMKTPAFAAAVNRDELRAGAEELGVDFDEHLAFVIAALEERGGRAGAQRLRGACLTPLRIVVLDGDETGQELLEQALRVLDPGGDGPRRRARAPRPVARAPARDGERVVSEAAAAMREAGFGIKAATVTPEGKDDVGSPNRILREEVDGKVIVRTGRRIPGAVGPVSGVHYPISVVRMAVGDAYGAEQWREGEEGSLDEVALRTERITRDVCRAVAEFSFRAAERGGARVYGGPKWTVSPVYEGMLKEEMDAAAERHPDVDYQPVLIDATYAGLLSGAADAPLVIPALNRDGDCLSDLVMPMFGSIAGAESILLSLRRRLRRRRRDGRGAARDRAVAAGQGPRQPDGDDPRLRRGARPGGGQGRRRAPSASRARSTRARSRRPPRGVKTFDLGGQATTTEFTDAVVERVRTKVEIWSSLGSRRTPAACAPARLRRRKSCRCSASTSGAGDEDRAEVDAELRGAPAHARPVAVGGGERRCWRPPGSS